MIYYAVQGLRRGQWETLFAPFPKAADALAKRAELKERNPACKYRVRFFGAGEPVVEHVK
jgi:hypothetical protein